MVFMIVSLLRGHLADADEARSFLGDSDKSKGPRFAAHEEPFHPCGRVLRRRNRLTTRDRHAFLSGKSTTTKAFEARILSWSCRLR